MAKLHVGKDFWVASLRGDGAAFRAAVGRPGALALPVPSRPDWTVLELVRHLGAVYRWVHVHANRGVTTRPESMVNVDDVPTDASALPWWDERYAELLAVLDALDPSLPAWNWAPQAKRGEFWHRRMAHETAINRWDAQMSVGISDPIEAKLASDGVSEVLDTWLPAGRRTGPRDRHGVVGLHASDVGQLWHVRLRGEGVALLDLDTLLDAHTRPERAVATGTASDLNLALWGRVGFDVLDVTGDATLLEVLRVG